MSTLAIRKKSPKVWQHIDSVIGSLIVSNFYFVTDNNKFQLVSKGRAYHNDYDIPTEVTLYDDTDTGTPETFTNALGLSLRLEELGYPAYLYEGEISSIFGLIEAGTNVTITGAGTASNPYVISSSGGGGGVPTLEEVLTEGNDANGLEIILSNISGDVQKISATSGEIDIYSDAYRVLISANGGLRVSNGVESDTIRVTNSIDNSKYSNISASLVTLARNAEMPDKSGTIAFLDDIPTIDATPTDGSANAVSSNGVFDALGTKQNVVSGVSDTEISYLDGVRSSIQAQIDALRLPIAIDTGNRTHTGTVVETVVASLQIPANTLDAVCNLFMPLDYGKTSGSTVPIRLYRNTTNVLGGATQIAIYNTGSNRNGGFLRKMLVRGTSMDLLSSATTSLISNMNVDLLFTATDTQTIAPSGNIWILVTVALDATGTVFTTKSFAIEKQKLG